MTTKPTTSTKPFRVTGPGTYKTRGGQTAMVNRRYSNLTCPWSGTVNGLVRTWRTDGFWVLQGDRETGDDLVRLIRLDKPRPAKAARRGKAQWCVVVRCKSKRAAEDTAKAIGFSDDEVKAVVQRRTL